MTSSSLSPTIYHIRVKLHKDTVHGSSDMTTQREEETVLEYLRKIRKDPLNISPRNRLLNFRPNKKTIELLNDASSIYKDLTINEKRLPINHLPNLEEMFEIDEKEYEGHSVAEIVGHSVGIQG